MLEKLQISKVEKGKEIHQEAIAELEEPLEKILERIGSENFDLIIGDDASGRIPTLILSKFFKAKAEKEGEKIPQTIFVTSSLKGEFDIERRKELKEEKEKSILELLKKQEIIIGKPLSQLSILIVTDTIGMGATLEPLTEVIGKVSGRCLIATIGLISKSLKEKLEKDLNADIVYGFSGTPKIWQKHGLGGVERGNKTDIHSRLIKKPVPINEEPSPETKRTQAIINLSREDANIIASRLIEKFLV